MDPGKLNKRIEIYANTKKTDETLGTTKMEQPLLKRVWANIQPRTGSLLTGRDAGTMLAKTTHVITARSEVVRDVTNDCYIMWADEFGISHKFDIDYILPPAGCRFATIYVQEVIR